jgi:hypothetical protein
MKKQINPTIKAHLIRSAFYVLLLLAVCVIPFALAQRNTGAKNTASKSAASKNVIKRAANKVVPATTTFGRNDPRAKGKSKSASSTRFSNARGTAPRRVVNGPAGGAACWYDFTVGTDTFVPGVADLNLDCDDCGADVALPFPVTLYGQSFSTAHVGRMALCFSGLPPTLITCPPFGIRHYRGAGSLWGDQTVFLRRTRSLHYHGSRPTVFCISGGAKCSPRRAGV